MFRKEVTKLWQGKFVSVRDYEVRKAINKGGMLLYHKDKYMTIYPEQFKQLKPNTNKIQSNYKGTYKLVDILFKPEERMAHDDLFKED